MRPELRPPHPTAVTTVRLFLDGAPISEVTTTAGLSTVTFQTVTIPATAVDNQVLNLERVDAAGRRLSPPDLLRGNLVVFLATLMLGSLARPTPGASVTLAEVPEPNLPGAEWVGVGIRRAGVCGSDTSALTYGVSPELSALASYPAVMGHEAAGVIRECGEAVRGFDAGAHVVMDPFLVCRVRGLETLCGACERGYSCVCENITEGAFSAGLLLGTCRDLGGTWLPYPYLWLRQRMLIVRFEQRGESRVLLFNATDHERAQFTPFFHNLQRTYGSSSPGVSCPGPMPRWRRRNLAK